MITFTVPETLRSFIRSNQRIGYAAMFKASSEALKVLAADEKHIGGDLPGFFGVLHTWGRQLQYHPHIHYIVCGGALSKQDGRWHPSRMDFYVPNKPLSKIFKAKFCHEMKKAEMLPNIASEVWKINWNVNIQPIGASQQSVKYLAPYVFKVAISNSRIAKVKERKVTIRYQKGKSSRWRSATLDVLEFIRRFLQHVLPAGFMKVRHYGFMSPSSSTILQEIASQIELAYGFAIKTPEPNIESFNPLYCPCCGGKLEYRYSMMHCQLSPLLLDTG
jgi:hypothetical protein